MLSIEGEWTVTKAGWVTWHGDPSNVDFEGIELFDHYPEAAIFIDTDTATLRAERSGSDWNRSFEAPIRTEEPVWLRAHGDNVVTFDCTNKRGKKFTVWIGSLTEDKEQLTKEVEGLVAALVAGGCNRIVPRS